jgi:hypothetical protein
MYAKRMARHWLKAEMRRRRIYQMDVALRSGVDQPTVSRVINRYPLVSAEKVAAVFTAIDELLSERPLVNAGRTERATA